MYSCFFHNPHPPPYSQRYFCPDPPYPPREQEHAGSGICSLIKPTTSAIQEQIVNQGRILCTAPSEVVFVQYVIKT